MDATDRQRDAEGGEGRGGGGRGGGGEGGEEGEETDRKSNNPHLTGGEKKSKTVSKHHGVCRVHHSRPCKGHHPAASFFLVSSPGFKKSIWNGALASVSCVGNLTVTALIAHPDILRNNQQPQI